MIYNLAEEMTELAQKNISTIEKTQKIIKDYLRKEYKRRWKECNNLCRLVGEKPTAGNCVRLGIKMPDNVNKLVWEQL